MILMTEELVSKCLYRFQPIGVMKSVSVATRHNCICEKEGGEY